LEYAWFSSAGNPLFEEIDTKIRTKIALTWAQLSRSLRRISTSGEYLPEVDGIRFFAISAVFFYHLAVHLSGKPNALYSQAPQQDWFGKLAFNGWFGVQLFFVLSGFILALPFARHYCLGTPAIGLRQFFLRRMTRLEPPYLLIMFALFLYGCLTGGKLAEATPHLLIGSFYLHNLVYGANNLINPVAWSLEIEIQFYLLTPLLAQCFRIKNGWWRRTLLAVAAFVLMLFQLYYVPGSARLALSILNFLQYFLAGFVLADLYVTKADVLKKRALQWDWVAIGCVLLLFISLRQRTYEIFFSAPLTLLLYYAAWRSLYFKRLLQAPLLTKVGGMCYTIYLIHFPLISFFGKLIQSISFTRYFSINLLLQAALIYPLVLGLSGLVFLVLEKPCMKQAWPKEVSVRLQAFFRRPAAVEPVHSLR
jgi:peptidoglycan/LPS O-acetylase OafA/YrhL